MATTTCKLCERTNVNVKGYGYCWRCYLNKYQFCYHCAKRLNTEKYTIILTQDSKYVCKACKDGFTWRCGGQCDGTFSNEYESMDAPDGTKMCPECWHGTYMVCPVCDQIVGRNDTVRINMNGRRANMCLACGEERGTIREWNYEPEFKFFPSRKEGRLYYGFEFEMECLSHRHEVAKRITRNSNGLFYCVRDGSLTHGIEIISNPATYPWVLKNMKLFRRMFETKELGLAVSSEANTCGLHINMSREAFDNAHLYRFINFLYKTSNRSLITRMSRRTPATLKRWARLSYDDHEVEDVIAGHTPDGHYYGVNLSNRQVVEVRLFNGTLDEDVFLASLEFCEALYKFTKVKESTLTTKSFLSYAKDKKCYPNLVKFVTGGIAEAKPSPFESDMLREKLQNLGRKLNDG